jgi:hypothetical protein
VSVQARLGYQHPDFSLAHTTSQELCDINDGYRKC